MANPWDSAPIVQKAQPASPAARPLGSPDPYKPKADARADNADQRDATRLGISLEDLRLRRENQRREDERAALDRKTIDARGGVDTTESEKTAGFLATRLAGGLNDLARIGSAQAPDLVENTVGRTQIGNYALEEQRQRIFAAQNDMLDALLTLGTGAAYTKEQFENYRQSYFPQPGDGPQTVADKQFRLQRALEAAKLKAGAAAPLIDTAIAKSGYFTPPPAEQSAYGSGGVDDPNGNPDAIDPATGQYLNPIGPNGSLRVNVTGGQPSGQPPQGSGSYQDSLLSQGMSGVNTGIGNTLGAPVDLATAGLNLIPQGINAVANTNLPTIQDPFMGGEWWNGVLNDAGTIAPETNDPTKQFVRRVGESVGGAAIPVAGTATTGTRAIAGLLAAGGGGVGAATAQQVAPGNPLAEMGGEVAGALLSGGGLGAMAGRAARREAEAAVPSIADLKNQASSLYSQAESRGVVAGPNLTTNLSGKINQIAADEKLIWPTGETNPAYPRASASMRMLDAHSGQSIDPRQIQVLRDNLADAVQATEGKERRIAKKMLDAFDEETGPLAPELPQARKTASKYLQAEQIERVGKKADTKATQFTQSGDDNAIRTTFRGLEQKINDGNAQFNPAVVEAIQKAVRGGPVRNAARWAGGLAPSTSGHNLIPSLGLGGGAGYLAGDPSIAALVTAGTAGVGVAGRAMAGSLARRDAEIAQLLARNGGPLTVPGVVDDDLKLQIAAQLAAQMAATTGK